MFPQRGIGVPGAQREIGSLPGNFGLVRRTGQIIAFRRNHMANTASRIIHVTVVARDHMNMHMGNGLSGGIAGIESDVVAVRLRIQLLVKLRFDDVDQLHQRRLFCCRCCKPGGDCSFRDDERVPRGHRELVEDGECRIVGCDPFRRGDLQEWRRHQ